MKTDKVYPVDYMFKKVDEMKQIIDSNVLEINDKIDDHETKLTEKATKAEVSAVDTKITNIGNASPKGTYATLSALQTAFPTGTTGIYLVTADGKWHYWNGSAWTAGGVYQSTGIADNSLTPLKTTFLEYSNKNLFNGAFVSGKYLSGASPLTLGANANYKSIFLDVKPNTKYSINKADSGMEDGNYWFKIATSIAKTAAELQALSTNFVMDGSVAISATSGPKTTYSFTTGPNDKSVVIVIAKYATPYVEVLEGDYNSFQYEGYGIGKYLPKGIEVYSKEETISVVTEGRGSKLRIRKDGNDFLIFYPSKSGNYVGYRYGAFVDNLLNVNVWKLIDIKIYDKLFGPIYTISGSGADNEGVLKINGEADYIGSIHGDEIGTAVYMYLDGIETDVTANIDGYYTSIEFLITSDVYHADSLTNKAFSKIKNTTFNREGVHIKNKWFPIANTTIYHVRACLLSVDKESNGVKLINNYRDSVVNILPVSVPPVSGTTGVILNDDRLVDCTLSGNIINARLWSEKRGGNSANYRGSIADFGTRLKPYIDCYYMETVAAGSLVYEEHGFLITTK